MSNYKPVKIKLANGSAVGIYVLLTNSEYNIIDNVATAPSDTNGNTKAPRGRAYKLEVTCEVVRKNKRCRGKKTINIPKGTSMVKAVEAAQSVKKEMQKELEEKGTLKKEKILLPTVNPNSTTFGECWYHYYNTQILTKKIRKSTYNLYEDTFKQHLIPLHKKNINTITIEDIQAIINKGIAQKLSSSTLSRIKPTTKPVLEYNDIILNWKKLVEPKVDNERKYTKSIDDTKRIIQAMQNYYHDEVKSIFAFSLTGRRISEILSLQYENIDWKTGKYTITKENVKTHKKLEFNLTPSLIKAIENMGYIKSNGNIFTLKRRWVLHHFKQCMKEIGITDMVLHDVRALVAQTALNAGANIYDVSAMLAHSSVATTEKKYVEKTKEHASKALNYFTKILDDEIIDVDVIDNKKDKFGIIKSLYPNTSNEIIQYVIDILECKRLIK
ncbi:MAG: tyrosine-type recombinase/integrase [Campylobacterota bacterium]